MPHVTDGFGGYSSIGPDGVKRYDTLVSFAVTGVQSRDPFYDGNTSSVKVEIIREKTSRKPKDEGLSKKLK
jgi:hypothetical protein